VFGQNIFAFSKSPSVSPQAGQPIPLRSFTQFLGFDGTAFHVTRLRDLESALMYVDRDTPDGQSTHVWTSVIGVGRFILTATDRRRLADFRARLDRTPRPGFAAYGTSTPVALRDGSSVNGTSAHTDRGLS
jgi:hypothetical protein